MKTILPELKRITKSFLNQTKAFRLFLMICIFLGINTPINAQSSIYESYVILNVKDAGEAFYDLQASTDFNGLNFSTHYLDNGTNKYKAQFASDNPPIAVCKSHTAQLDALGNATINASDIDGGSTDDIIITSISASQTVFTCANLGVNNVTLTVTDSSGQTDTCIALVTVVDATPPLTPTLADITGQCTATAPVPTTTDTCSGTINGTTSDALTYTTQGTHIIHWTFNDGNGQSIVVNQNVIIDDTVVPVTPTLADITGQCAATAPIPTTTDACSGTINGTTSDALSYSTQGTHIIHWTFNDGNGQSIVVNQNVIIDDTTDPLIPTLADITGQCAATASIPTTTDACAGTINGTTSDALSYSTQGTHIIHWTFNDGNGQSIVVNQNVIIDDTTDPVIPTLADITGQCAATASIPTTTDACAGTINGTTSDALSYSTQGTHIIHWTFNDGNGQSIVVNQNVIIDDTTDPLIPTLADITGQCTATAPIPTTTDACAGTINGTTSDALTYSTQGTHIIHWTFNDGNGQSIVVNQNVIIDDTTDPLIPTLADITGQCTATAPIPTTTDTCSGTINGTTSDALTYSTQGTHIIHWTFNDGNGQSIVVNQNVIIDDTTDPLIPTLADITGQCTATAPIPTTTDTCSGTINGTTSDALSYSTQGTHIIHWTFNDGNGQSIVVNQNVIIDDTVKPTLTVIADKNENIVTACNFTIPDYTSFATAADNCTTVGSISKTQSPASGTVISGNNATQLITITANDGNGNTETTTFAITLKDITPPTITCPANITTAKTSNDGIGNCTTTVALVNPVVSDNCTATSSLTITNNAPVNFPIGTTTVTWTVKDAANNTTTCTQNVTVTDDENPTITCPANIITAKTSNDGIGNCTTTVALVNPIVSDNCTATSSLTITNNAPVNFPIGTTTVTWTVKDAANNTTTCTQNVTVTDDENPTITCPSNQNVFFGANCQYTLLDYRSLAINASDNCGTPTITQSPVAGTVISSNTTVTLTVTDSSGRINKCTFEVIPTDNISPTAISKDITVALSATGSVNINAIQVDNGSTDNCSIVKYEVSPSSFNCNNIGVNVVTLTVYDNAGLTDIKTAIVTVVDTTPPTMLCNNFVVVVNAITRVATIKATDVDNGSNDACGIASLTVSPNEFSENPTGAPYTVNNVILTATDVNGNANTCTVTVTIEPPKNINTYLSGEIVDPIPTFQKPPSALIEATACPGSLYAPKDVQLILKPILNYNLIASDVLHWEYSKDNGETWIIIPGTAGLLTYTLLDVVHNTFVRLSINETQPDGTKIIQSSAEAFIRFLPPDEPPTIVNYTPLNICLGNSVTINAVSFFDQQEGQFGEGGKFNFAQPDGWRVDGKDGEFPASGDNKEAETWKETNSTANRNSLFSGINYDTSDNTKFAIAHAVKSNIITTLETPVFSTIGMTATEAIMSFYQGYYFCGGGYGTIQLSFDSGNTYPITLNTVQGDVLTSGNTSGVQAYKGTSCTKQYPVADPFQYASLNLGPYVGLSGLRVKFTFYSGPTGGTCNNVTFPKHSSNTCPANQTFTVGSAWAIDDVGFAFSQVDDELEWTDEGGTVIAIGTTATVTPVTPGIRRYGVTTLVNGCKSGNDLGTNFIDVSTSLSYAGEDFLPVAGNCGEATIQLNAYDNTKKALANYAKGAWKTNLYAVPADASQDFNGTGVTGLWSIVKSTLTSTCGSPATFSSNSDPDAIFTGNPGTYTLRWTLTNGCFDEVDVKIEDCKAINFDGNNDYVTFKDNYNFNGSFSIEIWVKPNVIEGTKTIFSRKDALDNSNGYDLSIVDGQVRFNWYTITDNGSIRSSNSIGTNRWYHLAVTFNSTNKLYKLYIDGIDIGVVYGTMSPPAASSSRIEAILGAMDRTLPNQPVNYYNGWIDEFKIWNIALSKEHIRQMMNQEIDELGLDVGGVQIPTKVYGIDSNNDKLEENPLVWSNLQAYYRMNIVCGVIVPYKKGVNGRLRNILTAQEQTAPIPYTTKGDGNWNVTGNATPWTYGNSVWDYPNSLGVNGEPIDWNIVKTSHNINSDDKDITVLGLISTTGKIIMADPVATSPIEKNDGQGLWITHYLKLNGVIDLVGESQLVQKQYSSSQLSESILDETSTGYIERDQQGKRNSFNYNYWSSPVSIQGGANNAPYSIAAVLKDGTISSTPKTITFGDSAYFADSALTSPIKISNRWIWSYNSIITEGDEWANYYQWNNVANTGLLKVGEGYTMKGTGGIAPITTTQNYVFVGKPNSGTISLNLNKDSSYLVGNPYPSALDANEFIKDNLAARNAQGKNVFNGALYFWDHFGNSNNHLLAEYQGGYATYSLVGGVVGINDSALTLNNGAKGSNRPEQYIPVGQGFFVDGYLDSAISGTGIPTTVDGGALIFKNSQRAFIRENAVSSIFMKKKETAKTTLETRAKIRLGFDSAVGTHRQLLVGADPNTTDGFDIGYDAPMYDTSENDMFWEVNESQFVIQGVPDFNTNRIIPLGLAIANEGEITLKLDELENVSTNTDIYLFDSQTAQYHDLKDKDYKTVLTVGNYDNRFSLRFTNQTLGVEEVVKVNDGILALYSNNYKTLIIRNNLIDTTVNLVTLFNLAGQKIAYWDVKGREQKTIQIPIKNLPSEIYIVKINTTKGEFSKKIIIK